MVHCALLVQRRKRHLLNTSNASNGAGASRASTNPAHCKKHLLPTSPIQVSCSLKNCVSLPHKNSPLTRAPVPQVSTFWRRTLCSIYWSPLRSYRYAKGSQRHEQCSYATQKRRAAHAGRNTPSPNRNLPCSNITWHSCCMQSHPLQQISGSQILLTNSQHTASAPS